ncbi:MAG: C-GCAxxG-C-C family (seleno)protein [Candidatus Omnitrophota bacterium]
MLIKKAQDNFLGKSGLRYNCAQAVVKACADLFELPVDILESHAGSGRGNAPKGYCGALYAALHILDLKSPDKVGECEQIFLKHFGALTCKEIKTDRKNSCLLCVSKAAEFLHQELMDKK